MTAQVRNIEEETLNGVLERILFSNQENHYCIGEFRPANTSQTITIVGTLPGVQCGETLDLRGSWVRHPQHGQQFKISNFKSKLPATVYGIRKYLSSGMIAGIGKVYANKIVDHFGAETLKIISEESVRLKEVPGIGKKRVREIKRSWDEHQALREVMLFLKTYGLSTAQCLRLVKTYGERTREVLQGEPYRLAREVDYIGFKTADKIALNLGFPNNSSQRLDAGILFAVESIEEEGHTCVALEELQCCAAELLQADPELIAERIRALAAEGHLRPVGESSCFQRPILEKAEKKIATSLTLLMQTPSGLPAIRVDKAIAWAQERMQVGFAPEQTQAIRSGLTTKISIITGGPGTGKTTILRALVDILKVKRARVLLAAPTGRAAQRMAETTGAYAQTIHRLLKFDPLQGRFTINEKEPLSCDFLIIDEASMLDCRLAADLLQAVPALAHVLLVGDVDQLPSVGAGDVLKDLIHSGCVPVTALQQIFRQQERSAIILAAHGLLKGKLAPPISPVDRVGDLDPSSDFHFIRALSPERCIQSVVQLCRDYIPARYQVDPLMDLQVLAPMYKGSIGISSLNSALQEALNPKDQGVTLGAIRFQEGDKLIQTRNNYDLNLFNGDSGQVVTIDSQTQTLKAGFDGKVQAFERSEMGDLELAYCISIHKSQGSEFPIVVMPLLKQHFIMLRRNLLYTALTRARQKVFVVGDPKAWVIAARNNESTLRTTDLQRKIKERL